MGSFYYYQLKQSLWQGASVHNLYFPEAHPLYEVEDQLIQRGAPTLLSHVRLHHSDAGVLGQVTTWWLLTRSLASH